MYGEELNEDDYDYVISLEKDGDKAVLIAQFNDNTFNNERIDIEVTMPLSLVLLVDDRSGDITIESVSNGLTLNDRSGDINGAGDFRLKNDGSGDVNLRNIKRDLK